MQTIVSSQGFEYGVKHFYSPEDGFAVDIIKNALNIDEQITLALFNLGSVYINNQRCTDSLKSISVGSILRVHTKPRRYYVKHDWISRIIFESDDFIILNKPAGLPSHPSVDNILENSLTQLELALKIKLHISHRLDTTTEGLIVYGKNIQFVKDFNIQLQKKLTEKKYVSLVQALPHQILPKKLIHYMEPSVRAPKKVSLIFNESWDECELHIEKQTDYYLENYSDLKILKINLLTGRTHQIRAQLSEIGFPLVGDATYGSDQVWLKDSKINLQIALKACEISFNYRSQRHTFNLPENFE